MGLTKTTFTYRVSEEGPRRLAAAADLARANPDWSLVRATRSTTEMEEKTLLVWMEERLRESMGLRTWAEDNLALFAWNLAQNRSEGDAEAVLRAASTYAANWKPKPL